VFWEYRKQMRCMTPSVGTDLLFLPDAILARAIITGFLSGSGCVPLASSCSLSDSNDTVPYQLGIVIRLVFRH
jgi:hypothetical protein